MTTLGSQLEQRHRARGDLTIPAAENIGKDKQKPRQPELDGPGMRINHVK